MAHICYAAGTTVAIDADSRRIAVSLDLAEQAYAGQTRIFDYSNNPDDGAILNKLEHINQGDAVYINYFDFTNADGSLVGVKIDLYTGQFPFGDEMP